MPDLVAASMPPVRPAFPSSPLGALASHGELSAAQAALSCIIGRGCHVGIPGAGSEPAAGMRLLLHAVAQEPQDWSDAVILSGAFGSLQITQGERLLHALSGIHVTAQDSQSEQHWQWLQAALCGRLRNTPFADVHALDWTPASYPQASVLRLTLNSDTHAISVHARASATHWLNWLDRVRWKRTRMPWTQSLALPLEVPVLLARHTLPVRVAAGLRAGDIILPDQPFFDCDGRATMTLGKHALTVQMLQPGQLKIVSMDTHLEMSPMENADIEPLREPASDSVTAASAHADAAADLEAHIDEPALSALDAVPLTLSFELGRSQTTLGALRELGSGMIMTINGASASSIAIVSGGYRVGSGEVVDVDGQIGIRIVQWGVLA